MFYQSSEIEMHETDIQNSNPDLIDIREQTTKNISWSLLLCNDDFCFALPLYE